MSERLAALAAEALVALLPDDAAEADWLFGGPAAGSMVDCSRKAGTFLAQPDAPADEAVHSRAGAAGPDASATGQGKTAPAPRLPSWFRQSPADQQLGFWLRRHPSLGPRERRWLSDRVHDVLRNGRAYELFLCTPEPGLSKDLSGLARQLILLSALQAMSAPMAGEVGQGRRKAPEQAAATPCTGTPSAAPVVAVSRPETVQARADAPADACSPADAPAASAPEAQAAGEVMGATADNALAAAFLRWQASQPPAVRYSLPDWFWAMLVDAHGEAAAGELAAHLLKPASVDIRCNLLKGKPAALQKLLAAEGVEAQPVAGVPTALRLSGRPALTRLKAFQSGWFEPQDAGSQLIAETAAARRGEKVIDFCAGAGGKTLALAARMRNQGQILAFDNDDNRLVKIEPRLQRAGVSIVNRVRLNGTTDLRLHRYARWADLVLIDAPCSGSGTVRRHPDLKWRLRPEDIAGYQRLQQEIFRAALALVRPGGRLVYATCSLFAAENRGHEAVFQRMAAQPGQGSARLSLASSTHWLPGADGGDGYFMALWAS